jgi:CPA1 family monovalent cation:H+ antiporter
MLNVVELILGLLVGVAALALLARKVPIPYPILLVLGGLAVAFIPGVPVVRLDPKLVFLVLLPPLLYPAALFTPWRDFHRNLRPILLLAIGLVLFTTVVVGYLVHHFIPELPLAAGFALGAIISPPDAVAAIAVLQRVRVPRRVVAVLEGESLVNDATALVAFRFAVAAVATGTFSMGHAAGRFLIIVVGSAVVGLGVGWLSAFVQKRIDDPPIEITLSILTPFAAYLPAERFELSGVLAVVIAGLYQGWRIPEITTSRTRLQGGPVWEMIEFVLNGFIFLLIGLQLPEVLRNLSNRSLSQLLWLGGLISVAVIVIRMIWVFPATYLPRLMSKKLRARDPCPAWRNVAVVAWTGMRGVVSLAAALALPSTMENGSPFPGRDLILFLTFCVILATLVVQGLSLPWVIRLLGIKDDRSGEREERLARLQANEAALEHLNEFARSNRADRAIIDRLVAEYEDRIHQLKSENAETEAEVRALFSHDYEALSHEALRVEREVILRLRNDYTINDEALRRIQHDLDLAEARLRPKPRSRPRPPVRAKS